MKQAKCARQLDPEFCRTGDLVACRFSNQVGRFLSPRKSIYTTANENEKPDTNPGAPAIPRAANQFCGWSHPRTPHRRTKQPRLATDHASPEETTRRNGFVRNGYCVLPAQGRRLQQLQTGILQISGSTHELQQRRSHSRMAPGNNARLRTVRPRRWWLRVSTFRE